MTNKNSGSGQNKRPSKLDRNGKIITFIVLFILFLLARQFFGSNAPENSGAINWKPIGKIIAWILASLAILFSLIGVFIYFRARRIKKDKIISDNNQDKTETAKQADKTKTVVVNSSNNPATTIVAIAIVLFAFVIILFWAPWKNAESSSESKEVVCTIPIVRYYTFKKGDNRVQTIPIGQHNFSWTVQGGTLKGTNGNKTATITMSAQNEKLHGDLRKLILSAKSFTPGSDEVSLKIVIENVEYIN